MVVYLVTCKKCQYQYVGSTSTKFRLRFNNYKSCHQRYESNKKVSQELFHAHFSKEGHCGISDWEFLLIDQTEDINILRKREMFWQYKLDTFEPNGLNEREVPISIT